MTHLSNLLSNIQSGLTVRHHVVSVKRTKLNLEVLNLLYIEGFIIGFGMSQTKLNSIAVFLKYKDNKPVLKRLRIISVPSKRVYVNYNTIMRTLVRSGIFVISTSTLGIVSTENYTRNDSKFLNVGGELLFQIIC
jgi:small subunit ribosomal protein S8